MPKTPLSHTHKGHKYRYTARQINTDKNILMTTPTHADTLIFCRWLIPVRPANTLLENQGIALKDGKIAAILPAEQITAQFTAEETVQLGPQHLVLPGLINAHGHAAMSLMRGMADDYPLHTWLNEHIWPTESQWVGEEFVHDGSQLAIAEMIRSGTTCFSDMYFFPEITAQVAIDAGIRSQLTFPIFNFPSAWGTGPDDYMHKGLQLRDDFKHSDLINVVFGPHAPYTVDDASLSKVATYAFELDCQIQIHLHETQQEVDDAIRDTGKRPISRLNDLGILSPRTQCVHMTALNDEDIELIKATGSHVVHCPQSNLKLASGFTPVSQLLNEDVNVCLGTDGAASNNSLNLFAEMRSAALLAKAVANDAAAVTDWQALEMATINAAKALGIDQLTGSLETGKAADLIAVDLSSLEKQPIYQPISQLVYTECGQNVSDSWINGKQVLKAGKLTTLDSGNLIEKAQRWCEKIHP
jgi:5-methylthioadenosine/S-adenosylhomocysteine deaminase